MNIEYIVNKKYREGTFFKWRKTLSLHHQKVTEIGERWA